MSKTNESKAKATAACNGAAKDWRADLIFVRILPICSCAKPLGGLRLKISPILAGNCGTSGECFWRPNRSLIFLANNMRSLLYGIIVSLQTQSSQKSLSSLIGLVMGVNDMFGSRDLALDQSYCLNPTTCSCAQDIGIAPIQVLAGVKPWDENRCGRIVCTRPKKSAVDISYHNYARLLFNVWILTIRKLIDSHWNILTLPSARGFSSLQAHHLPSHSKEILSDASSPVLQQYRPTIWLQNGMNDFNNHTTLMHWMEYEQCEMITWSIHHTNDLQCNLRIHANGKVIILRLGVHSSLMKRMPLLGIHEEEIEHQRLNVKWLVQMIIEGRNCKATIQNERWRKLQGKLVPFGPLSGPWAQQ